MIDWYGVFRNGLWILGLAVAFAAFSYTDWQRGRQQPRLSLRRALGAPGFQAPFSLGMTLFSAGLALSSNRWWETAAWAVLGLLFAWQAVAAWLALRKAGRTISDQEIDSLRDPEPESAPEAIEPALAASSESDLHEERT